MRYIDRNEVCRCILVIVIGSYSCDRTFAVKVALHSEGQAKSQADRYLHAARSPHQVRDPKL